jgi:D-alanyl-lipoteichoic acid acyltransferase DltB (MBOAT superfamily)
MLFNSYAFVFAFLPATLAGCFLLARRAGPAAAQLWLIAASLTFYASWNVRYVPLLLGSVLFNYLIARAMLHRPAARRSTLLALSIIVDLGLLAYYKYTNFFVDTVNRLAGSHLFVATILLPLGISFYTFQHITLLVDVSGGETRGFRLRDFLLFVTFFPHLIAGPIVHHSEMMPQFAGARYRFDWTNMAVGSTLFAVGLFKKAVLADGMSGAVSPIYADAAGGHPITLFYAWAAAIGFLLQMYFDFSGYSDMALGLARMVGLKLPMNFNSPLKSTSIIAYWSNWHITLTRFLTAYVYTPIAMAVVRRRHARGWRGGAGSPGGFASIIAAPTMTTMLLSGLWHGAGPQYLIFGLLHGVYLTTNHLYRLTRNQKSKSFLVLSFKKERPVCFLFLTLPATAIALTYFHAESVRDGTNIIAGMAALHGVVLPDVIDSRLPVLAAALGHFGIVFGPLPLPPLLALYGWIVALLTLALIPPNILQIMHDYEPAITLPLPYAQDRRAAPFRRIFERLAWRPTPAWAIAMAGLSAGGILALNQVTEFLYWQF